MQVQEDKRQSKKCSQGVSPWTFVLVGRLSAEGDDCKRITLPSGPSRRLLELNDAVYKTLTVRRRSPGGEIQVHWAVAAFARDQAAAALRPPA